MEQLQERNLVLIKFEPDQVLFQNRETRKIYIYYNLNQPFEDIADIDCAILIRGIPFNKGVLYLKEESNLKMEIEQRKRSFRMDHFSEQQIANTFLPLFQCLIKLQQKGLTHGSVSLQNIVILEGEVRLRDWLASVPVGDAEYDDLAAVGKCMLGCTFLTLEKCISKEWEGLLGGSIEKYSKNFIIALLIFAKQIKNYYKIAVEILSGDKNQIDSILNHLFESLRPTQTKSYLKNIPKHDQNCEIKTILTFSPAKKIAVTHKKVIHHQNIENKEEQSKKIQKGKNMDKNGSVHELMNKKLNQEEKRMKQETIKPKEKSSIINLSNFGVQNNSKKLGFKDRNSPFNRMRPYSKRK